MAKGRRSNNSKSNGATLGFEATLWAAADEMRNNMDAAEYKHVVSGLIFLKYISDAFEERHAQLQKEMSQGADPEDPNEHRADNIFWVPSEARWRVSWPRPQPKSLANQVLRKISGARELYNRLILVMGSDGNGKTEALQKVQTA